jgi:hypothetical protein
MMVEDVESDSASEHIVEDNRSASTLSQPSKPSITIVNIIKKKDIDFIDREAIKQ